MDIRYKDLIADNLVDACMLLDAIGVEQILAAFDGNDYAAMAKSGTLKDAGLALAIKFCGVVIKNIPIARNEIYTFMANCIEWEDGTAVTVEDVRTMNAVTFVRVIRDFFKQDGITDFFKEVAGFVGMDQSSSSSSSTIATATPLTTSTLL